jgi:DNA-directed RNA polymerase specialized sigma24 family protein
VDECTTREIAEEFGVSANVVRLTKSRVSRRLKEILAAGNDVRE